MGLPIYCYDSFLYVLLAIVAHWLVAVEQDLLVVPLSWELAALSGIMKSSPRGRGFRSDPTQVI